MKSKKERLWWVSDRLADYLTQLHTDVQTMKLTKPQREKLQAEIIEMQTSLRADRALFRAPK